jgi:predicted dehydrogenase
MPGTGPVGVGFIGTGMISNTYLENLTKFPDVRVVILGDLNEESPRPRPPSTACLSRAVPTTSWLTLMSSWSSI